MITITKQNDGVLFTFENSDKYLYGNGTIEVPFNTLSIVADESDMITLKKAASNDVFISGRYDTDFGYRSKDDAIDDLKDMLFAETGGGGSESGITSGEVQTMIDESISGKADTSVVNQAISEATQAILSVSGDVQTKVATSDFNAYTAATASAIEGKQDALEFYGEDTEQWEEEDGDTPDSTAVFTQKHSDIFVDDSGDEGSLQAGVQSRVNTVKFNGVLNTGQSESVVEIFANESPNDTTEYSSSINVGHAGVDIETTFTDTDAEFIDSMASISMNNNDVSISLESTANGDSTAMVINTSGVTINGDAVATEPYVDAALSGKADTSAVTQVNNVLTAHTANTTVHVSQAEKDVWNAKVDTSAITTAITSGSTDSEIPTAKATYDAIQAGGGGMDDDTQQLISTALNDLNDRKADLTELSKYQIKGDYVRTSTLADYMTNDAFDEYATAKERIISGALNDLNDKFGGLRLVKISQADYDALTEKNENTLYIINNVI